MRPAQAYAKASEAIQNHPDFPVDYAELLALRAGNRMERRASRRNWFDRP